MSQQPQGKLAVWFVFATVLLDMIGIGLVVPVLPRLISEIAGRDIANASVLGGWLFFVYGGMQFLFGPAVGNLSDAVGRRPVLLLSVFGLGIDYFLTALAPTIGWLFIGRGIAGICGASYVTANAYLADITKPDDRARAFGLIGAAFGVGFTIGPALGGILGEFGPRVPFYAAAAFSLVNFAFGFFVLPETLPPDKRRPFEWRRANPLGALKVFSTYPGVIPLAAAMFVFFLASSVYPAIWAYWGIARFGWSEMTIGLSLAAFGLVTALTQGFVTGPIVARFGERRVMIFGLLMTVIAVVGYGLAPSLFVVMLLFVVNAPEGFVQPTMTAILSHAAPDDAQGEMQGGIASLQNLGMLIGTVVFAQIFGYFMQPNAIVMSPSVGFFVAAALFTLTLVWIVLATSERK
ncbi:MAG: TCR/Tet family MFS transporter [Hyphomicrobiaceae bacterium]